MAQFSALEQMTNLNKEFSKVVDLISAGQAMSLIGKNVEVLNGDETVTGTVREVTGGTFPQILVDGRFWDFSQVRRVKE
jgi:flagellar basal-body rod modification protein FlgD